MRTRILMATVASFALAAPLAAQDQVKPMETEQGAGPQQTQQPIQKTNPAAGAEESAPAEEGAPAMTEETPPAEEGAPAMTEETPPAAGAAGQEMAEEPAPPADMKFIQVQEEEQFLANTEVIGGDVVNAKGEEVGTIADLVMDPDQKLVGIVLSVGGFLGVGDKWVAVPVDQIEFPSNDQPAKLLVEVSREQLENAPDFVTRETVESQQAAEQAQQGTMQQQVPSPTATPQ